MERSVIRDLRLNMALPFSRIPAPKCSSSHKSHKQKNAAPRFPDYASLHPGYGPQINSNVRNDAGPREDW
jgi:hypothetical protein